MYKDGKHTCDFCKEPTPSHTRCHKCRQDICKKHGVEDKKGKEHLGYLCKKCKEKK